uniref:Uncharacterized protein n=2 Tax=Avena sativa TaxID=4498 RepID=A0ACD5XRW3_AVESA
MESTASWRLLPPASSPSPAFLGLQPRRQAAFVSSLQRPAISKSTILCLLHDKPAPTAQSSVQLQKLASVLQCAAVWAAVEAPAALATVSGEEDLDLLGILPPIAAIAFVYLFVAPPIIMNWMRLRWYKRKFVEMYLQFMFTYLFFPGLMLWAPFVNFRKFPRDPTMKYPWSKPKEGTPLYKDRYPQIDSFREKYY